MLDKMVRRVTVPLVELHHIKRQPLLPPRQSAMPIGVSGVSSNPLAADVCVLP